MKNKPHVQTYTACAGGYTCSSTCKYCISKLTPRTEVVSLDRNRFIAGARTAAGLGAQTFLITGKGEPTETEEGLDEMEEMLSLVNKENILPIRELQTNAVFLYGLPDVLKRLIHFKEAYGLNVISISAVSYFQTVNQKVIHPDYPPLSIVVYNLQRAGFTVRINVILCKEYMYDASKLAFVNGFVDMANADQLTFRSVTCPVEKDLRDSIQTDRVNWINENKVDTSDLFQHFTENGIKLYDLFHGASVFAYRGKNVCLSTCLTDNSEEKHIRQLIYCTDGKVRSDWKYLESVVL